MICGGMNARFCPLFPFISHYSLSYVGPLMWLQSERASFKFHFVTLENIMHHYIKNTNAESILVMGLHLGHLDTHVS